uniref:Uncharacterized protein n=1 Tax=Candidatus Kentrum sp. UNK TaxID=2126344 RepID=A0A451AT64_9GAMM|nr:MAG: hypothetical protein BECKUNK1418G_GA0071005_101110 [Candidatus Kentron sp. UNK]VFK69213.1 MAG: hypothetical protein BECKUNK1418H_GA0071006_101210 [Candidatus Kentron sp. UNK]
MVDARSDPPYGPESGLLFHSKEQRIISSGSLTADQIKDGDRYEPSNGHSTHCALAQPGWWRASLDSDPDLPWHFRIQA